MNIIIIDFDHIFCLGGLFCRFHTATQPQEYMCQVKKASCTFVSTKVVNRRFPLAATQRVDGAGIAPPYTIHIRSTYGK